jgi:hypothetical protein
MLSYPLEKRVHLPPLFVNLRAGQRRKVKMLSETSQFQDYARTFSTPASSMQAKIIQK